MDRVSYAPPAPANLMTSTSSMKPGAPATEPIATGFANLALVALFLFPVLPVSAGVNGMLAQLLFAVLALLSVAMRLRLPQPLTRSWGLVTLYYVGLATSMALRSWANDMSDYGVLARVVMPLAAILVGYQIAGKPLKYIRRILILSSVALLVIHASVHLGIYNLADIWYYRDSSELGQERAYYQIFRAAGTFGYPSEAAIILVVLLVMYVGRLGQWNRQSIPVAVLTFGGILATQSRAGIGLLAAAMACLILYLPGRKKIVFLLVLGAAGLVNVSLTYISNSFGSDLSETNLALRMLEQTYLYDILFNGARDLYGVADYRAHFGMLEGNYLTLFLRGGILALVVEVCVMLLITFSLFRSRPAVAGHRAIWLFTLLVFLFNALAFNFFTGLLVQGKAAVIVWSLWGYTLMLARGNHPAARPAGECAIGRKTARSTWMRHS